MTCNLGFGPQWRCLFSPFFRMDGANQIAASIRTCLPEMSEDEVTQLAEFLYGHDFVTVEDLAFVQFDDIRDMLSLGRCRRLLSYWQRNSAGKLLCDIHFVIDSISVLIDSQDYFSYKMQLYIINFRFYLFIFVGLFIFTNITQIAFCRNRCFFFSSRILLFLFSRHIVFFFYSTAFFFCWVVEARW